MDNGDWGYPRGRKGGANRVRLTWNARAEEAFTLNFSIDLEDWSGEISDNVQRATDDVVADDGDRLTVEIDLGELGLQNAGALFFRVSR